MGLELIVVIELLVWRKYRMVKKEYINDEAKRVIEQKLKQGKRIEMEYNHQTDELKILEHKITRIKLEKNIQLLEMNSMGKFTI